MGLPRGKEPFCRVSEPADALNSRHRQREAEMLRITVTRESDEDLVAIGEVVIGKFAGTEKRSGAARRALRKR